VIEYQTKVNNPMKKIIPILSLVVPILGMIVLVLGTTARAEIFGSTDHTSGGYTLTGDYKIASVATLSEDGTVDSICIYLDSYGAQSITGIIYSDSSGYPHELVAETEAITSGGGAKWYAGEVNPPYEITAGTYHIGYITGSSYKYYRSGASELGNWDYAADEYDDGPSDPWGDEHNRTGYIIAAYAHYTPSGENSQVIIISQTQDSDTVLWSPNRCDQ